MSDEGRIRYARRQRQMERLKKVLVVVLFALVAALIVLAREMGL